MTVFQAPGAPNFKQNSDTSYVAVVGPDTLWPEDQTCTFRDIADGTSNTICVVEIANSGIHWMEPRDLHVGQMKLGVNPKTGQGISSHHEGGAHVALCDGSTRWISDDLDPKTLRALLTIAGGEETPDY